MYCRRRVRGGVLGLAALVTGALAGTGGAQQAYIAPALDPAALVAIAQEGMSW